MHDENSRILSQHMCLCSFSQVLRGLQGITVPEEAMTDWYRMCDALTEHNLMTDAEADLALASGIRKKRPDGWAVHCASGRRLILILEFTRCGTGAR
jgi:hypothetical protein